MAERRGFVKISGRVSRKWSVLPGEAGTSTFDGRALEWQDGDMEGKEIKRESRRLRGRGVAES
jgi:hypothetical protein